MSIRLTNQPVALPRPLNVARPSLPPKPAAAPQQEHRVNGGFQTTEHWGQATDRIRARNAAERIGRAVDRFEHAGNRYGPWNKETYGEKIERNRETYERVFGHHRSPAGTTVSATGHIGVK